jgi:hypothetical protein
LPPEDVGIDEIRQLRPMSRHKLLLRRRGPGGQRQLLRRRGADLLG